MKFQSGAEISRIKLGTGTICLKSYKNSIILGGCYDGYIYAYDTKNEIQLSRFPGPGKMLLHFDVHENTVSVMIIDPLNIILILFFVSYIRLLLQQKINHYAFWNFRMILCHASNRKIHRSMH